MCFVSWFLFHLFPLSGLPYQSGLFVEQSSSEVSAACWLFTLRHHLCITPTVVFLKEHDIFLFKKLNFAFSIVRSPNLRTLSDVRCIIILAIPSCFSFHVLLCFSFVYPSAWSSPYLLSLILLAAYLVATFLSWQNLLLFMLSEDLERGFNTNFWGGYWIQANQLMGFPVSLSVCYYDNRIPETGKFVLERVLLLAHGSGVGSFKIRQPYLVRTSYCIITW